MCDVVDVAVVPNAPILFFDDERKTLISQYPSRFWWSLNFLDRLRFNIFPKEVIWYFVLMNEIGFVKRVWSSKYRKLLGGSYFSGS